MTPRRPYRFASRLVAGGLASLVALIGAAGEGLHALACDHHDSQVADGSACDGHCGCQAVVAVSTATPTATGFSRPAPERPSHDHDCAICRLLGQFKQSVASADTTVVAGIARPDVSFAEAPSYGSVIAGPNSARGPPAVA